MKKTILFLSSLLLMSSSLYAEGFLSQTYVVVKGMYIQSGSYEHNGATITGKSGSGVGVDFGYSINEHFAAELTYSQGANKVEEHHVEGDGSYTTSGLLGVYLHHLGEDFSLVGKLGYVSESETLEIDHHTTSASHGGGVAVLGAEYKLGGHNELVLEYENVFIEGPKGASIFIGWKHGFGSH